MCRYNIEPTLGELHFWRDGGAFFYAGTSESDVYRVRRQILTSKVIPCNEMVNYL